MERTSWARTAAIGTMAVAFLLVLALPALAPGASAATVGTQSNPSPQVQWAYGAETWANASVTYGNGSTFVIHSYYGWNVVWSATNTSNTTEMLEVERTAGVGVFAEFCAPNCAQPVSQANLTLKAWEKSDGFVNLTRAATVNLNGSAVPAWGILNESGQVRGNLTETLSWQTTRGNGTRSSASYLSVADSGSAQIAFATPLGVLPLNVSPGEMWTSTAAFTASGSWQAAYTFAHTTILGTTSVIRGSPNGSVQSSGDVTLVGHDLGTIVLRNGETTDVVVLAIAGPFSMHEGLLLVPGPADLLAGGGGQAWSADSAGVATLATDRVDVRVVHGAYVRFDAAGGSYAGSAPAAAPAGAGPGVTPAASTQPAGELQAQPESVPQAEQGSSCLVGQCSASGGSPAASGLGTVVVIALLAGLVVGSIGVIEYRQWAKRGRRSRNLTGPYYGETMQPVAPGATLTAPTRPVAGPQTPTPGPEPRFPGGPEGPQ
jgi:hypothetical protein